MDLYVWLILLISMVIFTLAARIVFYETFIKREGLSASDIFRPITRAFQSAFNAVGNAIKGFFEQVFKKLTAIGYLIKDFFEWLASVFSCGIFYIKNFWKGECFIIYFLHIVFEIFYLPFRIMFWATGLQSIESLIWNTLKDLDNMIKQLSGYRMSDYIYPDECYGCRIRKFPKLSDYF